MTFSKEGSMHIRLLCIAEHGALHELMSRLNMPFWKLSEKTYIQLQLSHDSLTCQSLP